MAYSSKAGLGWAAPRGGTKNSVRASEDSNNSLRLGLAADCRRRHCSIGTSMAVSVPRHETN
jgi:hypothetical protein